MVAHQPVERPIHARGDGLRAEGVVFLGCDGCSVHCFVVVAAGVDNGRSGETDTRRDFVCAWQIDERSQSCHISASPGQDTGTWSSR